MFAQCLPRTVFGPGRRSTLTSRWKEWPFSRTGLWHDSYPSGLKGWWQWISWSCYWSVGSLDFHKYLLALVDNTSAVNILDLRRDNESVYPMTIVVARGFLSVSATSVQWERLFSATGRLITKPRSRLLHVQIECRSSAKQDLSRLGNEISWELTFLL